MTRNPVKWTDFSKPEGGGEEHLVVCLVQSGLASAQATIDKFNRLYGPPPLAQLRDQNVLTLPWKEASLAYPLMDLALREGLTIFTQTRTPIVLRPDDMFYIDVLTPENLELLHVGKVEEAATVVATLAWICDLHPGLYHDEGAWLTEAGRKLVRAIRKLFPPREEEEIQLIHVVDDEDEDEKTEPILIDISAEEKEEEPEPAESDKICPVCIVARAKSINLSCMCVVFCATCAQDERRPKMCPYCRKVIECVLIDDS